MIMKQALFLTEKKIGELEDNFKRLKKKAYSQRMMKSHSSALRRNFVPSFTQSMCLLSRKEPMSSERGWTS